MVTPFGCIVVFSHLRHDGVRQRPQHLVSRLARRLPVLYVEEPIFGSPERDDVATGPEYDLLRPVRREPGGGIDAATIRAVSAWMNGRPGLAWVYAPMMGDAVRALAFASVVFDSMDDLTSFRFAPPALVECERELVLRADVVFTGGGALYERLRAAGDKVKRYSSGVDVAHFAPAAAPDAFVDPLLVALCGPVFGYAGVIDERLDLGLFAELAARGGDVVVIGPFAKIDVRELPGGPRIHYTGIVPYGRLPHLYAGLDVALMPFAESDATRHLSPTKTPEYLAAGRAVVSTRIADVARDYGDVVDVESRETFADRVYARAATRDPDRVRRGIASAARGSWDAIEASMWADVAATR